VIHRSGEAKKAKAAFFRSFNDVDIYVEDNKAETKKLITQLLRRVAGDDVRVDTVFPLGPRTTVVAKCRADQETGGRPRVYIIDGDMDLCLQRTAPRLRRLYRLPRYCIENYLVDEDAIAQALAYDSVVHDVESARAELNFDGWIEENGQPLRRLFLAYAVCLQLGSGERTISYPVNSLVSDPGSVDPLRVESRITELRTSCDNEFGGGTFERVFAQIASHHQHKDNASFLLQFVSAKDYLLKLMRERMKRVIADYRKPDAVMKVNLASSVVATDLRDALFVAVNDNT